VVEETAAEDRVEDAVVGEVPDVVADEPQVPEAELLRDVLAALEVRLAPLDPERVEPGARELDRVPAFEAPEVGDARFRSTVGRERGAESAHRRGADAAVLDERLFRAARALAARQLDVVRREFHSPNITAVSRARRFRGDA